MLMPMRLKAGVCWIFLPWLLGVCSPALTIRTDAQEPAKALAVVAPRDGQRIGEADDPLCPAAKKYCNRIRAQGRVPAGAAPFFAVEPELVSPKTWIQPVIQGARADGTFAGLVNLGDEHNGVGEYFKIYVLACKNKEQYHTGDVLMEPPKDCQISDPVEVFRTR